MYVLRELLPRLDKRPAEQLMRKPRTFDGSNSLSWINPMDLYMSRAGVPEQEKLSIALSYLDAEALDWHVQALNQQTRPRTSQELKAKLKRHYSATTDEEALEKLKRVRQDSAVLVYLQRFSRAASACIALWEEPKTKLFVRGLTPEIQNWVYPQKLPNMDAAITEAVRAESELTRQRGLRYRPDRAEAPAAPSGRNNGRAVEGTTTHHLREPTTRTPRARFPAAPVRGNLPRVADPRTRANRVPIPTEAVCFACGRRKHFRAQCPQAQGN